MRNLLLLALLLAATPAAAGTVVVYENDFDAYTGNSFSGTDGWVSHYASDTWSTWVGGNVYAKTDDSGGTWGSGGAIDNHLVYTGASFGDFQLDATVYSADDDGLAIVFRFQDAQNFYMALFGGDDTVPGTGTGAYTLLDGARLYRVSGGSATTLDSSNQTFTLYATQDVRVVADGASLEVWLDLDDDGVYDPNESVLSASDATFSDGYVGFYCYNNGFATAGCAFDDLVVSMDDTDGDGVADVDDNCPATANASQADADGDGTGDACDADADGDGSASTASGGADCDDTDASVHPAATESCATAADDDCDGSANDAGATGCTTFHYDGDADAYGDAATSCLCSAAGAYTATAGGDCDDADAAVHPGATETCDDADQDCDGDVDEDAADPATFYGDADQDGFGDAAAPVLACDAPAGAVADDRDCDDLDAGVNPDADELCDGADQDCDGAVDEDAIDAETWYVDGDGDGWGYGATVACDRPDGAVDAGGDCDDADPAVHPEAEETADGRDEDCDGLTDEAPGVDPDDTGVPGDVGDPPARTGGFYGAGCATTGGPPSGAPPLAALAAAALLLRRRRA